jgi:hypothetical protein
MKPEACRYLTEPGADTVPEVIVAGEVDPQLPCSDLSGKERKATLVVRPIDAFGCTAQRTAGLCPRRLGAEVDPALQLNALAKNHA